MTKSQPASNFNEQYWDKTLLLIDDKMKLIVE